MLQSDLCDSSDVYIVVKGKITVTGAIIEIGKICLIFLVDLIDIMELQCSLSMKNQKKQLLNFQKML